MTQLKKTYMKILYLLLILVIVAQYFFYDCENLSRFKIIDTQINQINCNNSNDQTSTEISVAAKIQQLTQCKDKLQKPSIEQNGDYWVLYNLARAKIQFSCYETITFTTNGDFTFLDNIEPVVKRWEGPVSVSIHAPGDDYQRAVDSIRYLRQCGPEIIQNLVTFHVFFDNTHMPQKALDMDYLNSPYNCQIKPPYLVISNNETYKKINNVTYPLNVARNIARRAATTHFILPSDLELYPSKNIIPKFLDMIARNEFPVNKEVPRVFPLSVFEVEADQEAPENKTHLQLLLNKNKAIPFHKWVCSACHVLPKGKEWEEAPEGNELNVFFVGKRAPPYEHWEPFYIGTNDDPYYDERLPWDGKGDKMPQAYVMCVLNYDFMILDNAFLVHKPGIKYYKPETRRDLFTEQSNLLMKNKIYPELKILYGEKEGCYE